MRNQGISERAGKTSAVAYTLGRDAGMRPCATQGRGICVVHGKPSVLAAWTVAKLGVRMVSGAGLKVDRCVGARVLSRRGAKTFVRRGMAGHRYG